MLSCDPCQFAQFISRCYTVAKCNISHIPRTTHSWLQAVWVSEQCSKHTGEVLLVWYSRSILATTKKRVPSSASSVRSTFCDLWSIDRQGWNLTFMFTFAWIDCKTFKQMSRKRCSWGLWRLEKLDGTHLSLFVTHCVTRRLNHTHSEQRADTAPIQCSPAAK